jgi:hypothetical protein
MCAAVAHVEIFKYEKRRNVCLLEMTTEQHLQESSFSDLAIDARILNGAVSSALVHSGNAGSS